MLFASIVLALSGVEAVSNMTGVMTADPKKNPTDPDTVRRTSGWAIDIVATEVVVLTVIFGAGHACHAGPYEGR